MHEFTLTCHFSPDFVALEGPPPSYRTLFSVWPRAMFVLCEPVGALQAL